MEKYPYFIYPDVMELRHGHLTEEEKNEKIRKIAANVGDIPSLRIILGIDPEEFASFYPDMSYSSPSTLDTIDSFISNFAPADGTVPEAENSGEGESGEGYLEEYEETDITALPPMERAQFFIKNHKYTEALAIITDLNLNNPEKSIYFAHQIRFLKKLLLNEAYKKRENKN